MCVYVFTCGWRTDAIWWVEYWVGGPSPSHMASTFHLQAPGKKNKEKERKRKKNIRVRATKLRIKNKNKSVKDQCASK